MLTTTENEEGRSLIFRDERICRQTADREAKCAQIDSDIPGARRAAAWSGERKIRGLCQVATKTSSPLWKFPAHRYPADLAATSPEITNGQL